MRVTDIVYDNGKCGVLPDTVELPDGFVPHIVPIEAVKPEWNFLLGYMTGVSRERWYGIEGIYFIFMGSWNDPYVGYKGYAINCHLAEDAMWSRYSDEVPAPPYDSSEYKEYEEAGFSRYMAENRDVVFELLDNVIDSMKESVSGYVHDKTGKTAVSFKMSV